MCVATIPWPRGFRLNLSGFFLAQTHWDNNFWMTSSNFGQKKTFTQGIQGQTNSIMNGKCVDQKLLKECVEG